MTVMPHNHNMWAIIGIYTGREDNILWRRIAGDPSGFCCWTKMTAPMIRLAMGFPAGFPCAEPLGRRALSADNAVLCRLCAE
jgi:hypothetical protein